jgi:hypothetical protein
MINIKRYQKIRHIMPIPSSVWKKVSLFHLWNSIKNIWVMPIVKESLFVKNKCCLDNWSNLINKCLSLFNFLLPYVLAGKKNVFLSWQEYSNFFKKIAAICWELKNSPLQKSISHCDGWCFACGLERGVELPLCVRWSFGLLHPCESLYFVFYAANNR